MDALSEAAAAEPGLLRLAVAQELSRVERPLAPAGAAAEVDSVLQGPARVVEVESVRRVDDGGGRGHRWLIAARGTARCIELDGRQLQRDELGALWAHVPPQGPARAETPRESPQHGERPLRCVAVVGLLHVNGVV